MFEKTIFHRGLHAYRVVKGQSPGEVDARATHQQALWEERWQKKIHVERTRELRTKSLERKALGGAQRAAAKQLAIEQTRALDQQRADLDGLLTAALSRDPRPDWNAKKSQLPYPLPRPTSPQPTVLPPEPNPDDPAYKPSYVSAEYSLLDKLIRSRRERKCSDAETSNQRASEEANRQLSLAREGWAANIAAIKEADAQRAANYEKELVAWSNAQRLFIEKQRTDNAEVDALKARYFDGEEVAVVAYVEDVLSQSQYPDDFPREHRIEYIQQTGTLVIDFELPNQTVLPEVKEVKYIAARGEFQKVFAADTWIRKTYDEVLYQISLRTLYELFEADEANALVSVVFNGLVRSIDKATGAEVHACVMSLEARKDEFLAINLKQVDPRACFKKLKGVAASKLIELTPIKPLAMLNKEDKRFVEGYAVANSIDERTNLAAMDWLDFENLIREVFEKEFSRGGGEVKITQASRDGGVDAVAFDPDPIRGGKLVIQAKRYTNTVGVSAVRDLYGTVHNEGANKGILVTTSDFGPDAYAFAKDKPLTLISGAELLYLLSQHGHKAKIDLAEAKRMAAETAR